jgi:hypothetical protein
MSDVDMSDEDANSSSNTNANSQDQQYLLDTIAQLENRLHKAHASIYSYQNERSELLGTIIQLKITLQNVVNILEK